jgi:hypothetical protein
MNASIAPLVFMMILKVIWFWVFSCFKTNSLLCAKSLSIRKLPGTLLSSFKVDSSEFVRTMVYLPGYIRKLSSMNSSLLGSNRAPVNYLWLLSLNYFTKSVKCLFFLNCLETLKTLLSLYSIHMMLLSWRVNTASLGLSINSQFSIVERVD